jgi:hypothetical protein
MGSLVTKPDDALTERHRKPSLQGYAEHGSHVGRTVWITATVLLAVEEPAARRWRGLRRGFHGAPDRWF